MKKIKVRENHGPEWYIQQRILKFLRERGWFCKVMAASSFMVGMPDIYACKRTYGSRWIEVKNKENYRFTPAQLEVFPRLAAENVGVWILTDATEDEYQKLFFFA
jgi:hypothetical protein